MSNNGKGTGSSKKILLLGARGFLGSKVLQAVLEWNDKADKVGDRYIVQALVRPGSDAGKLEQLGVDVVRGDMMDVESLRAAMMDGVDIVVNTANGYMQGHIEVDIDGAKNVADAIKASSAGGSGGGVKRYVFCSVLTCNLAPSVEHFHVKYEHEEYCKSIDLPAEMISLRPGGFLDQVQDFLGDAIVGGNSWALCPWNKYIPIGMIYTPELAKMFAKAAFDLELPVEADNRSIAIDVGWSRPISYNQLVEVVSKKIDRPMTCYGLPLFLRKFIIYTYGWFDVTTKDMLLMFNYFDEGTYINDTTLQNKYFGPPPTPEEVIGRYVDTVLAAKAEAQE